MTIQSFKKGAGKRKKPGVVVFTPDDQNGSGAPGKWEYEELDGAILLCRDKPRELILILLDEGSLSQSLAIEALTNEEGLERAIRGGESQCRPRNADQPF